MYIVREARAVLIFPEKPSWKCSKWLLPKSFLMNESWFIWSWGRGHIFVQYISSQIHKLLMGQESCPLYSISKGNSAESVTICDNGQRTLKG